MYSNSNWIGENIEISTSGGCVNFKVEANLIHILGGPTKTPFIGGQGPSGADFEDIIIDITASHVHLASGEMIDYAYLTIATGSSQPLPAKVLSTNMNEASEELRNVQEKIQAANRIAIIGGGAMGVEIATDMKSFFPSKEVTLFHSRYQLLPRFGRKLHDFVLPAMEKLGIQVVLEARLEILLGHKSLRLAGVVQEFDLVVSSL